MGGFFFGKKKAKIEVSNDQQAQNRKSRRIVTPGGKPPAAAGAAPAPAAPPPSPKAPAQIGKPATQKVVRPSAPAPAVATQNRPAAPQPQRPVSSGKMPAQGDPLMFSTSAPAKAPAAGSPQAAGQAPARPKSQEPIRASKPLEFSGGLAAAAGEGPARTGDAALLEFLINKAHLLDAAQAQAVQDLSANENLPLDAAAVKSGFLTEEQLVNALTQECWVPHLKVDKYEIRKKALDTITSADAQHFSVFPVDKLGSLLTLAMVNPLDTETIRILENKTGLDIKKVVATRGEIAQGIEKYYGGLVEAKDTSIGFTQDAEPKSVTQMMSKVATAAKPEVGAASAPQSHPGPGKPTAKAATPPAPAKPAPAKPVNEPNIVPEIEDIDDLLSADDAIAPSIIEPAPITIDPGAIEPIPDDQAFKPATSIQPVQPLTAKPAAVKPGIDRKTAPTVEIQMPSTVSGPGKPADSGFLDLEVDISMPAVEPAKPAAKAPASPVAPPASKPGALERIPPKPPGQDPRFAPTPLPGSISPPSATPPAQVKTPILEVPQPATGSSRMAKPPAPIATGSSRLAATKQPESRRIPSPTGPVNLIPVMEEEFQHAITHGRSHVFEKWVGLQSRNRIINAVPIEDEVAEVISALRNG